MKVLSVLILILIWSSACAPQQAESTPPHWTYEGEEGPSHWGELDESYATCRVGKSQSPIDVENPSTQDLANISFHYQPSAVNILNNGHTVQVNYDSGSYMELEGIRYDVVQFHYHAPSEHTVDGESFPAELHIVHRNADGELAVVGILLREGTENAAYQPFISNLPAETTEPKEAGVNINAIDLLPSLGTTFRYKGSLTTPPCTEGVSWLLMTTPVELSAQQLTALDSLFETGNNRPVQPINDRALVEDTTP
ncbi:MAG TPA: carbonic anhydrase family protein [Anaerolineales bacterium]|nr:carbonic anhydrase family protein [Anaerolineales bacterium]